MSVHDFLLALVTGSAGIGLWIAVRFPRLAPASLRGAMVAVAVAFLLPLVTLPLLVPVGHLAGMLVAIFAVALPTMVYVFLAGAWFMLCLGRMLAPHLR